jgi:hypothetical protein
MIFPEGKLAMLAFLGMPELIVAERKGNLGPELP